MQRERKKRITKKRITKKEFYDLGGFANSDLFRLQTRGRSWRYYTRVLDCDPHNYIRLPGTSLGCVTYRCTHCGNEFDKDIS